MTITKSHKSNASTLCALLASLAIGGCDGKAQQAQQNQAPQNQPERNFNCVVYVPKPDATINQDTLGKFVKSQPSTLTLYTGGTEQGRMDMHDADGDNWPDALVFRRANGDIAAVGLDYGSATYSSLSAILQGKADLYDPKGQK